MIEEKERLGDALARLYAVVAARRHADPSGSYTAKLLSRGPEQCAKKFGEEAVEAALAGALQDRNGLTAEAADCLYHLLVLMASVGVEPDDVAAELTRREGTSGLAEKAARKSD